ncbi:S-adenosyl-L-methionine-dependent methyltransferase [Punctularia strigosozonata HHB-11173 SS5]|uniref:S-adenosyl-L-methionine-dependent methyltransferase n=1 Tax=Punctularia strigosozonata (strain HHB-11173) TaxID=741275 RepID=UPI0004417B7E|nr:S-adenosyl-L-methionine-dependent methyltransferase [Punctularia strigosozonata HHB-11173 SS5]EIN08722.1 S-adenosyl-L-methionine-dependent methyltransferase [Punctularia strigosozonata HHB-11173 SS5]
MSPSPVDAVAVAEQLLELVKKRTTSPPDSTEFYDEGLAIQATADKLLRTVMGPLEYTALLGESCQESQALYFVTSFGIADIIGDGALGIAEISEKTGVDTQFLGVVMSCMLGRGYFEEVETNVYRNNELSAVLRDDHPDCMKSAIGFVADEGYKAASRLIDVAKLRGPSGSADVSADAGKARVTGTNLAFGFDCSVFDWMAKPEQAWRGERLGRAMKQLHGMANQNVPKDYAWNALKSPIVDCGGGIGALEMAILKDEKNLNLEFTIFDIPQTVENAKRAWSALPERSASRVSFAPGNFLASSLPDTGIPLGRPTYLIRHVLHDWTDAEVLAILRNVRAALASSPSEGVPVGERTLVVCEMLLRPDSSRFVRTTSMQLLALNNGITRTLDAMRGLIEQAGFVVRKVHSMRAVDSIIEAVVPV